MYPFGQRRYRRNRGTRATSGAWKREGRIPAGRSGRNESNVGAIADAQLPLAILNLALGNDALATPLAEPEQTVPAHTRRKPVRKLLSDSLPRVTIEILPPEA